MNLTATTKDAYKLFHDGSLCLAEIGRQGVRIDTDYCEKAVKHADRKIARLERKLEEDKLFKEFKKTNESKTWNPWSKDQLAKFLFTTKRMKPVKETKHGKPSTDAESLRTLGILFAEPYIERFQLVRNRDVYLKTFLQLEVDGFIYPTFNLHIVGSYRSSSNNPNWQYNPKRDPRWMRMVRRAIIPRPGRQLFGADYSGVEVCVGACYHEDPEMIRYITTPNTDMHRDTAIELFKATSKVSHDIRHAAKNQFVFPEFYGSYWAQCAPNLWQSAMNEGEEFQQHLRDVNLWPYSRFEAHVKKVENRFWGDRFKVYDRWKKQQMKRYEAKGYIESLTGFRYTAIMDRKQVANLPIQGSAFHCLLQSLIWLNEHRKEQGWGSKIVGQIHDEVNLDIEPNELTEVLTAINAICVKRLMDEWRWIIVPLKVEADVSAVDGNWSEMSKVEEEVPF